MTRGFCTGVGNPDSHHFFDLPPGVYSRPGFHFGFALRCVLFLVPLPFWRVVSIWWIMGFLHFLICVKKHTGGFFSDSTARFREQGDVFSSSNLKAWRKSDFGREQSLFYGCYFRSLASTSKLANELVVDGIRI